MVTKPRETYDIAETAARAGAALDKLRAEQSPAVRSGRGGKAAVLRAVRDRLQALSAESYTTGQVADALRTVIPSMSVRAVRAALREAARESAAGKKGRQRKSPRETRAGTAGGRDAAPMPPTAAPAPSSHAGAVSGPVWTPTDRTPADPVPSPDTDAAPPAASPAAVPTSLPAGGRVTDEQRAQYQIPPWADGTDLRPGETLERYARRKRVAGPPPDRSKFIGES